MLTPPPTDTPPPQMLPLQQITQQTQQNNTTTPSTCKVLRQKHSKRQDDRRYDRIHAVSMWKSCKIKSCTSLLQIHQPKEWNKNERHDSKRHTTTKKFLPRQSTNNTIEYGNNTIDDKNNKKTNVLMKPTSLERWCTKIILLLVEVKME
jgi:hypothetical protein